MNISERRIPPMHCDHGCGECCGLVAVSRPEFERVRDWAAANGVEPRAQGVQCPFFQEGQCAVYPVRPTTCRLFGQMDEMQCPRGYRGSLSARDAASIAISSGLEMRATGVLLLHDLVYPNSDLVRVVREATNEAMTQLTIGGRKPSPIAYDAGRQLKILGRGMEDCVFIDQSSGVIT